MDSTPLSSDPFHGLNPAELMAAAAQPTDGDAQTLPLTRADLPTVAEITAAFPELEILGLIGHGGMSAVFKARQPRLDRLVVLKVLPKSLAATPGFPERFTREGRVLARLSHPGIVTVHDFGESGGFCYLIMEYVDGVNLRQAMRAGRFTPEQALSIVPVMCDALQYAHTQGVLHRDIKPENILLDAKGRVKIVDFGIAKILDEKGGDTMLLTQSGARLGTAPYMAPEQIEKPASVDHRADIYSLGVVFYEMLTGELPLGRFAAPSEKAQVGVGMDEIVFRALAKERERRQQSADEFKTQIEGAATQPPQVTPAVSWQFQSFEYASKRRLLGMPLLHVTRGVDPTTGRQRVARGFFAFGDSAVGVVACGGRARGIFACGGLAVGVVAMGGMAVGLVCWGGLALALVFALGGLSIGTLASGGLALGWQAVGGVVFGWYAQGGVVIAQHGLGGEVHAPHVYRAFAELPAVLRWMSDASGWMSLGSFLWLPLALVVPLVQRWAQHRVRAQVTDAPTPDARRLFWLMPAVLVPGILLGWLIDCWARATSGPTQHLLMATITVGLGLLLFCLNLPLWLRLLPINSIYGFRIPSAISSPQRWYEVNAYYGKQATSWAVSLMVAGMAGFYQLPRHQSAYAWAALALCVLSVFIPLVATFGWLFLRPTDKAPASRLRLYRWGRRLGQVCIAVCIALFIKSFIGSSYKIQGAIQGVSPGSHWFASHLDTGFSSGDLVVYEHDQGGYWIAHIVAVEKKGLLVRRSSAEAVFAIPWSQVVGRMLFSHFSREVPASLTLPSSEKVDPGSSLALHQPVRLRFTRLALNRQPMPERFYTPEGKPVPEEEWRPLIARSSHLDIINQNADACWLQLWFEHPDFDKHSMLSVQFTDLQGQPLVVRDGEVGRTILSSDKPHPPLQLVVMSPGQCSQLPQALNITLRYSMGPWEAGSTLAPDFRGSMSLGNLCLLAAFGETHNHRSFVSWSKPVQDQTLLDAVAVLKDGHTFGSSGHSMSSSGTLCVERIEFAASLQEVAHFQFRDRPFRTITFKNVIIPPLP